MMNNPLRSFDFMFSVAPIIIGIIFIAVLVIIVLQVIKAVTSGIKNNNAPVLTVTACVVAKRGQANNDLGNEPLGYYVTFQMESGDRMEFKVPDAEYGLLAESDEGQLTFQGTRYKGFERRK